MNIKYIEKNKKRRRRNMLKLVKQQWKWSGLLPVCGSTEK